MLVSFNSRVSNIRQKTNFGAINQKHMAAVEKAAKNPVATDAVIRHIGEDYVGKALSRVDLMDTLNEILRRFPNKFKEDITDLKEDLGIK